MTGSARSRLLRRALKHLAAAGDAARRPRAGLTVLIYHRVEGGSGGEVDLDGETFDRQLGWLRQYARVSPIDAAVSAQGAGQAVSVTFDDGTADFVDNALPILVRHQVPVTLYVATSFVEEQRAFPWGAPPASWSGLAEAVSTGLVTIGSHTHTHALLDRIPRQQVADELDRSIDLIGERLGVRAEHFAYPKAVLGSPEAQEEVAQRFRTAAIAGTRPNPWGAIDPMRLHRSPIQRSDGMRWFRRKAAGRMALEDTLRRALNRFRYADAVT